MRTEASFQFVVVQSGAHFLQNLQMAGTGFVFDGRDEQVTIFTEVLESRPNTSCCMSGSNFHDLHISAFDYSSNNERKRLYGEVGSTVSI
jgi:hypothetical protein